MGKAKQAIFAWAETYHERGLQKGQQIVAYTQSKELSGLIKTTSDIRLELTSSASGAGYDFGYGGRIKFHKLCSAPLYTLLKNFDSGLDTAGRPHSPYAHILIFDDATFKEIEYNPMPLKDLLMYDQKYSNIPDPKLVGGTLPEIEIKAPVPVLENLLKSLGQYEPLLQKTVEILKAEPTKKLAVFLDDIALHNDFVEAVYLLLPLEKRKEITFCTQATGQSGHAHSLTIVPLDPTKSPMTANFLRSQEAENQKRTILKL